MFQMGSLKIARIEPHPDREDRRGEQADNEAGFPHFLDSVIKSQIEFCAQRQPLQEHSQWQSDKKLQCYS